MTTRVSIIGGSGYTGGELLRLLLRHPEVEVAQVTARQYAGKYLHSAHPNLRGVTALKFTTVDTLEACDLLFLALPHGEAANHIEEYAAIGERIIDLSADFRLHDPVLYETWYGNLHPAPQWLERFVYGLPELHREQLRGARYASGVGCNATVVNLGLWPLACRGLIESAVVEVKVGSSEGGSTYSLSSHHPERSGSVRSFAPTGHRHQAEVRQELGDFAVHFSATAIEMVRGALSTAHVFLTEDLQERDVWRIYRESYGDEPFVRIVKDRQGVYRYPEPKLLAGTNLCDVGFEKDPHSNRLVVIGAIDNLMKGAAGSAVQAMNLMFGWDETTGLDFIGLHPV
jgi:N-acetyl-gamma-glutamyl-phosphate/LysW-gamma-L-alpha-aminoadipyl-6-phosphate reductase